MFFKIGVVKNIANFQKPFTYPGKYLDLSEGTTKTKQQKVGNYSLTKIVQF